MKTEKHDVFLVNIFESKLSIVRTKEPCSAIHTFIPSVAFIELAKCLDLDYMQLVDVINHLGEHKDTLQKPDFLLNLQGEGK